MSSAGLGPTGPEEDWVDPPNSTALAIIVGAALVLVVWVAVIWLILG